MSKIVEHRNRLLDWVIGVTPIGLYSQVDKNAWVPQLTKNLENCKKIMANWSKNFVYWLLGGVKMIKCSLYR